jgi:Rad3-related DNA helicase
MISQIDWIDFFPLSKPREEQIYAINFALEAYEEGKTDVVLNLGTGVGKSAVAITIARYLRSKDEASKAYILTSQKILQDQYAKDFDKLVCDIRSASNFRCNKSQTEQSCAEVMRVDRKLKVLFDPCATVHGGVMTGDCPYRAQKLKAKKHPIVVTNYSYFMSETQYAKGFSQRDLLIYDESHRIEEEVRKWGTITVSQKFAHEELGVDLPEKFADITVVSAWMNETYVPALEELLGKTLLSIASNIAEFLKQPHLRAITRKYMDLDKHICQINRFVQEKAGDQSNFLIEMTKGTDRHLTLKPLDVTLHAWQALHFMGQKRLFMTATMIDEKVFKRSVGISQEKDIPTLTIRSPFPKKNRQVLYVRGMGKMTMRDIDDSIPDMATAVKKIIDQHPNVKGIIHTNTNRIAKEIKDRVKSSRLIFHGAGDRDEALERHCSSTSPTVLVSPSMAEGIDLRDDLSRFQIICKVPFPFLGDPVIRAKLTKHSGWYRWMTARTIVQACGRSVRNMQDHAVTYVIDASFEKFYKRNKDMLSDLNIII